MQRDSHYWACISSYMLAGWCVDITFSFNQQPNEMESWFRPPLAYIPVYKDNKSQVYKMTQFSLATKNWITNLKLVLYCSQSETILVVKTCHNAKHFFCFHFYFSTTRNWWSLWYLYINTDDILFAPGVAQQRISIDNDQIVLLILIIDDGEICRASRNIRDTPVLEQCKLFVWLFPVKPPGETIFPLAVKSFEI